jgi:hypothetical protein
VNKKELLEKGLEEEEERNIIKRLLEVESTKSPFGQNVCEPLPESLHNLHTSIWSSHSLLPISFFLK